MLHKRGMVPQAMSYEWDVLPSFVRLPTITRSQAQAKPAALLIPMKFPYFFSGGGGGYSTRYQSGSLSLNNVGSVIWFAQFLFSIFMQPSTTSRMGQLLPTSCCFGISCIESKSCRLSTI